MKSKHLNQFFCCPNCFGELKFAFFGKKNDEKAVNCLSCSSSFKFEQGVLDFIDTDKTKSTLHKNLGVYDEYWASASGKNFHSFSSIEEHILKGLQPKKQWVVADIGCGNGRHIDMFVEQNISCLICMDSSTSIYDLKQKFGDKHKSTDLLYVRCDIEKWCLKNQEVDILWVFGIVNFFSNQEEIILNFIKTSRRFVVLGLLSKNFFGSVYYLLNVFRKHSDNILLKHLISIAIKITAYFVFSFLKTCSFFGLKNTLSKKFLNSGDPIAALKLSLSEPFTSPEIFANERNYYRDIFDLNDYRLIGIRTDLLSEIYLFGRKDH